MTVPDGINVRLWCGLCGGFATEKCERERHQVSVKIVEMTRASADGTTATA